MSRLSRPDAAEVLIDTVRPDVAAQRSEAAAKRARLGQLADLLADGTLTREAVRTASARLPADLADVEACMADSGRADVLSLPGMCGRCGRCSTPTVSAPSSTLC